MDKGKGTREERIVKRGERSDMQRRKRRKAKKRGKKLKAKSRVKRKSMLCIEEKDCAGVSE